MCGPYIEHGVQLQQNPYIESGSNPPVCLLSPPLSVSMMQSDNYDPLATRNPIQATVVNALEALVKGVVPCAPAGSSSLIQEEKRKEIPLSM